MYDLEKTLRATNRLDNGTAKNNTNNNDKAKHEKTRTETAHDKGEKKKD